jgi:hypothetical protein
MISPKLAILMATMAVVGAGALPIAPMALADRSDDPSQRASVDIERNNSIRQSIDQEQEACTNEADVAINDNDYVDIAGENEAEVDQENDCIVVQDQDAENNAAILDLSDNDFDIEQILASLRL